MLKKLTDKKIFVNENVCQATFERRKELQNEIKYLREEGKIAYLQGHCGLEER